MSKTFQNFLKTAQQINCQMPLNSMEKCHYRICQNRNQTLDLEKFDKDWNEFLKAQQDTTANYLYNIKVMGSGKDPTLDYKEPVSEYAINQRLLHMPYVGGLFKGEMFYLLSFVLNLMKLDLFKRKEYLEYIRQKGLLDKEILNYLLIIIRQRNLGLNAEEIKELQVLLKDFMDRGRGAKEDDIHFYNSEHIFLKSSLQINPYELEYLKSIFETQNKLNLQQSLYLAHFVDHLEQLELEKRQQYLSLLYKNHIIPFHQFETLKIFMRFKSKRIESKKLKILLQELFSLMNLKACVPDLDLPVEKVKSYHEIEIDYIKINKAFKHLMKIGTSIPNIVRLNDLKYFLKSLLLLQPVQIEGTLQSLKFANILYRERFQFIENFINSRHLGRVEKFKKKMLLDIVKKVTVDPVPSGALLKLDIPASKGPPVEKIEKRQNANKNEEEIKEAEKKKEEEIMKEPARESKEKSTKKLSKKKSGKKKK